MLFHRLGVWTIDGPKIHRCRSHVDHARIMLDENENEISPPPLSLCWFETDSFKHLAFLCEAFPVQRGEVGCEGWISV